MVDAVHDAQRLAELQALPLSRKIQITQTRIIEWYQHYNGNVYVSFSGGKDSTVLLHLVRQLYPAVPAVFSNTGLEYPEITRFAHSVENVTAIVPKMRFNEVISTYGYPVISKEVAEAIYYARRIDQKIQDNTETARRRIELHGLRTTDKYSNQAVGKSAYNKEKYLSLVYLPFPISHMCCRKMKKYPVHSYLRKSKLHPFIGTLAEESRLRKQGWIKHGCNAFGGDNPSSQPLSFWTEQDILTYIVQNGIEIASVYGKIVVEDEDGNQYLASDLLSPCGKLKCSGCQRTGCIFCGFGFHNEKGETRFQRLAKTHPKQYEYALGGGQWVDNPAYDATAPRFDGEWENWNPKKIWVPSKDGIGLRKVFDMVNEIYGKDFYRYE